MVMTRSGAGAIRKLTVCRDLRGHARGWIGSGLRVKPPNGSYKGPVHGEHDAHWYIRSGRSTLHIVDGYAWHSGLPLESLLTSSVSLETRGWEFGQIVGLDLAGQTADGRRWRWFGAPISEAISYESATAVEAAEFDRIIDTVCFAGAGGG